MSIDKMLERIDATYQSNLNPQESIMDKYTKELMQQLATVEDDIYGLVIDITNDEGSDEEYAEHLNDILKSYVSMRTDIENALEAAYSWEPEQQLYEDN